MEIPGRLIGIAKSHFGFGRTLTKSHVFRLYEFLKSGDSVNRVIADQVHGLYVMMKDTAQITPVKTIELQCKPKPTTTKTVITLPTPVKVPVTLDSPSSPGGTKTATADDEAGLTRADVATYFGATEASPFSGPGANGPASRPQVGDHADWHKMKSLPRPVRRQSLDDLTALKPVEDGDETCDDFMRDTAAYFANDKETV